MKKYIYLLLVLMAVPMALTSCIGDDDEVEYDDYCYISGFTLGSMKRVNFTVGSDGEDSAYTTSFQGGLFPMTIDQRNLTIENLDSMPLRTNVSKVLTTVKFVGVMVYRKADISNEEDTTWTTYDSSDSLDFSSPLKFRVYASDANSSREYTVKLNVHQQRGDTMVWNRLDSEAANSALSTLGERKAVVFGDKLWVIGENGYANHALATTGDWTAGSMSGISNADVQTLQKWNGKLYLNTTDGSVLSSEDGINWSSVASGLSGISLVAASEDRLYALYNGALYSSLDGSEWIAEVLDADASCLPTEYVAGHMVTQGSGSHRLVLVGNGTSHSEVWSKAWSDDENSAHWMYYNVNSIDKHRLPSISPLCLAPYDEGLVALGGACSRGGYQYAALDSIFYTADYGINWKTEDDMIVDPTLKSLAASATRFTAATDEDGFLWVVVDDEVWRGRTNRLGWVRQDR